MSAHLWTEKQFNTIVIWKERGASYRWLYDRMNKFYDKWDDRFSIPLIIMGYIVGGLGFSETLFPEGIQLYVTLSIACFNTLRSIIDTIFKHYQIIPFKEKSGLEQFHGVNLLPKLMLNFPKTKLTGENPMNL